MSISLFELTGEYLALANKLENSDYDEVTIRDTLESASGELEVKAVNVAMFIRNLESTAEQIKLAEKAMSDRRKAIENKAESIKKYLFNNMSYSGITKIESPYFVLSIKKNPPSVVVDDLTAIPVDYFVIPPIPEPVLDKALIKRAISEGYTVPGVHLEQGTRLYIK